jgi:hypothetical protein
LFGAGGFDAAGFEGKKSLFFDEKKLMFLLRVLFFFVSLSLNYKGLAPK